MAKFQRILFVEYADLNLDEIREWEGGTDGEDGYAGQTGGTAGWAGRTGGRSGREKSTVTPLASFLFPFDGGGWAR